jgi:UDP-N-acetylglucosamine--N-acetylmuramyl-(pentapeptide) pyrophosphoryl-undecaprenol N-acetylglucosamine transferase
MLFISIIQSIKVLRIEKPNFVIIMGGYVGIPMAIASKLLRIHLIIHEQNAIPGLANKVISKVANQIFCGFENSLKGKVIGNPIRKSISNIRNPQQRFQNKIGPLKILILGGSLGASAFNKLLPPILHKLSLQNQIEVIHQSGEKHYEELVRTYLNLANGVVKDPPGS